MEKQKPIIAVISIWAEDTEKEIHFYKDLLGFPVLHHSGPRLHFDLGGTYLTVIQGKPKTLEGKTEFPLFAFRVDNLEKYIQIMQHHGIETPFEIEKDAHSRWVKIIDPAGNLIELLEA